MRGGRVILPAVQASARRTIVAGPLSDLATSAFAAVILWTVCPPYYASVVVGTAEGRGDFWWGAAVSTAMVTGALTSPPLGGVADHAGARKPFFVGFSVACIVVTALLATVGHGMAAWGWTLAVMGIVTYEAAFVYYNSYLPRIAPPERIGRVSASRTLGFSFTEIIELFMVVQVTALLGSAAWARPTDSRGPRFVVTVNLVQWALVTVASFFVVTKGQFWVVAVLAGTGLGAIQAASRTFMATLVPPGREAEFFGFYSLVGKTGAIFGPLVFGGVSWLLSGNQRTAILSVGLL